MTAPAFVFRNHDDPYPVAAEDLEELGDPAAKAILDRLYDAVDPEYPHRLNYVIRIAALVLRAKRQPFNRFARPTL